MIIQLIGVNSKYIHPANGVFQLVANSNYPVQYFEATIKDPLSDIISKVNHDADLIGLSVYIWNINKIVELIPLIKENALKQRSLLVDRNHILEAIIS